MLQLFLDNRYAIQTTLSLLLLVWAMVKGGGAEKLIALAYVGIFHGGNLLRELLGLGAFQLTEVDFSGVIIDSTAAIAFITIALKANRGYTLFIAAFQLISLGSHLARELLDSMTPLTYAIMYSGPADLIALTLAFGMIRHLQRKKKFGAYRDWRKPLAMLDR